LAGVKVHHASESVFSLPLPSQSETLAEFDLDGAVKQAGHGRAALAGGQSALIGTIELLFR